VEASRATLLLPCFPLPSLLTFPFTLTTLQLSFLSFTFFLFSLLLSLLFFLLTSTPYKKKRLFAL
jgi:hypothetical protein